METTQRNLTPMCSIHHDAIAKAVCLKNKELFCFRCALGKAKSDTYTIEEIGNVSEEKEKLLLEYIIMKQVASRKENEMIELERKTRELKENLEQTVKTLYEKLTDTLAKQKENTIDSIELKKILFLKTFQGNKEKLGEVHKAIDENIEKISSATASNIESFKSDLNEHRKKLDETSDHDLNVEGAFIPKKIFQEMQNMSGDVLGEITINKSEEEYSQLKPDETAASSESYEKLKKPETEPGSQPPTIPPKPSILSSSESDDQSKTVPPPRKKGSVTEKPNQVVSSDETTSKPKNAKTTEEPKPEKSRKSMFGIFGTKDKKRKDELEEYVDVGFALQNRKQAKYLINTSLTLLGLESHLSSPCKFSKLVAVGPGRIGLLTTKHSSVVVAELDGNVRCKKYPEGIISIVAMEDNELAILTKEGTEIQTVKVSGEEFETKSTINIKSEVSDVTGFDYSKSKSRFAISTRKKHLVTDGKGKKIKSVDIGNIIGSLAVTTYDFNSDCIFVLNIENKSIKCVSLKNLESVWKCKCEDQLFQPKAVCLYQDKLCVTSAGTVTIFAAKDGKPVRKHETVDLVKDCLGICVLDDVLVLSSDSDTFEESVKLAFIGI